MRPLPLILIFSLFVTCAGLFAEQGNLSAHQSEKPPLSQEEQSQAAQATKILSAWQAENPVPCQQNLRIVYWTPSDRKPAERYRERLTHTMKHVQSFYRAQMERLGFGPLTFPLETEANGQLKIHLVKGRKPFAHYGKKSGSEIRKECLPSLRAAGSQPKQETLIIFCNLANWEPTQKTFSHQSPYYAGGSYRGGTAWLVDSPELDIQNLHLTEPIIHDEEYGRISLGKHNSIFIGGIAHELGHALSLPHNEERSQLRKKGHRALMGKGNQNYADELRGEGPGTHLSFSSALHLASQPLFSRSEKALSTHSQAHLLELSVEPKKRSFLFSGRIQTSIPVYGTVAYLDPEGSGDYDAQTATAVPDQEGRFTLNCRNLTPGKRAELRLIICHVNGATSRQTYSYSVKSDGSPEISTLQTHFALSPLIKALNSRDHSQLQPAFDSLHAQLGPGSSLDRANAIAKRLVASVSTPHYSSPKNLLPEQKLVPLSDIQPTLAEVGYDQPTYDHLPNPALLLQAGGQLFAHGIYAHAPARHQYELNQEWSHLSGRCAIADGFRGSSVFIIKVDNKEVYRSPIARSGAIYSYRIDLSQAKTLELITTDGGNGKSSDWATWLEPTLSR